MPTEMNSSFLDNNERNLNLVDKMSQLYDKSQRKATKKLIIASIICIIFMVIEIVAAIVSNSLSLMSDASHLFCDLLSFALNLFSIYVSSFQGNVDMSFGYHRAEIIGALFSIFFIWSLSAYILYTAIFRLFDVPKVNGYIMFITAFISTLANIFMAYVLQVHSHGFGFMNENKCSNHKHESSSYHDNSSSLILSDHKSNNNIENNVKKNSLSKRYKNINSDIIIDENDIRNNKNNLCANKMDGTTCNYVTFDYYDNMDEHDKNVEQVDQMYEKNKNYMNKETYINKNDYTSTNLNSNNLYSKNKASNNQQNSIDNINNNIYNEKKKKKKKESCCDVNKVQEDDIQKNDIQKDHAYIIESEYCDDLLDNHNHTHESTNHNHSHDDINNISLKTAYLHALSDLLQNVGVMIASLFIWYDPRYSIADPICSIIFCCIVFSTTMSVIKEILNILMEGTPVSINLIDLKNDLLKIPGVLDVHDLHVWSLSIGKPALACHIVASKTHSHSVLNDATLLCQNKYKILHTTVQTDYSSNRSNCETEAHLKCSTLKGDT
ncbi:putative zinc transporter [Plasmodium gaboni]|uniref:Putative zinc transporter n=1 Tax=Plasmodium gaboni TaxID=647221 RepID=A0A151LQA4_9APIC|nr:putative zinc transporter [Plasmodium gaboni]KYO01297.1 putative zinc transporter [Plasmodium gaboni]